MPLYIRLDSHYVRGLARRRKLGPNDVKITVMGPEGEGTRLRPVSRRGERFMRDILDTFDMGSAAGRRRLAEVKKARLRGWHPPSRKEIEKRLAQIDAQMKSEKTG